MPEEFIEKKLKNLINFRSGYTWGKEQESSTPVEGSVRVLTVSNIQQELDLSSELYLMNVPEKEKLEKKAERGWSIAVGSNGNRKRIGNAVYINNDDEYLFASFLVGFKPKPESGLHPRYFYQWLTSYPVQERITVVSEGTTGLGNLNIRHFRNMGIQYPKKYSEQEEIVKIFETLDEALKATQNSIAQALQLKRALMQHLLSGRLKPDGTWRKPDEFYVDDKFGHIPLEWGIYKFDELAEITMGQSPGGETLNDNLIGVPFIQGKADLGDLHPEPSKYTTAPTRISAPGDLLFTVRAPVGYICINNIHLAIGRGIASMKEFDRTNYLYYAILQNQKKFISLEQGTTFTEINKREIKKFKIVAPCSVTE